MNPQTGTPEQEARRDALVRWLVTGEEPADARRHVAGFYMGAFMHEADCGTVCCMAGAVYEWWPIEEFAPMANARTLLGIGDVAACDLFLPIGSHSITEDRQRAARVFQNWRETGVVDWDGMQ